MTWELIKEILRRAEAKAKIRGEENPIASIRIDSRERWRIFVRDDNRSNHQVDGGEGTDGLSELLSDVRGRQTF